MTPLRIFISSVQKELVADRLEVWNPGTLPPSLTLTKLREPHGSVPGNPLLAEPMYLAQYIERMGTGTGDMIRRCRDAGLSEPEFSLTDGFVTIIRRKTGEVGPQQESLEVRVLRLLYDTQLSRLELSRRLGQKDISGQLNQVIIVMLAEQTIEYTIPDKPTSSKQRYRLTEKGMALLASLRKGSAS
jgi:predicted HTH transcriptional regulator